MSSPQLAAQPSSPKLLCLFSLDEVIPIRRENSNWPVERLGAGSVETERCVILAGIVHVEWEYEVCVCDCQVSE